MRPGLGHGRGEFHAYPGVRLSKDDSTARELEQARFRTALDAAPNAILMADAEGAIVLCNRHTQTVFGHPRNALVGQPIEVLIPDHVAEQHRKHRAGYAQAPSPRAMGVGRELLARRADGSLFPVEVALQPVTMDDGDFVIASVVDITARVEAQRTIDIQRDELQRQTRELRALARSTSHDLKGPLTTIVGLASTMIDDLESGDPREVVRIAEWTRTLAERTADSVERLREIAESSLDTHPETEVAVAEAIEEVLVDLEAVRERSGVEIRIEIAADLRLRTEHPRFTSITRNLIENALLHHDAQPKVRWAEISAAARATSFRLTVRDNGVGIPEDRRETIFELFERARATEGAGVGIGLALVRRHVEHLGGSVRLEAGHPTTFVVELPLRGGE